MHLRTLGTLAIEGADFPHAKPLLLLAYLSRMGPQPRRRIATLFWPSSDDPLNRLSVTLSRIRADLPNATWTDGMRVGTRLGTDVDVLQAAVAAQRWGEVGALYEGAFLDGVYVRGLSEEIEEWIFATSDDVARCTRLALIDAAETEVRRQGLDGAIRLAEMAAGIRGGAMDAHELQRLHALLLAVGSPVATAVRREAEGWDVDLADSRAVARTMLGVAAPDPLEESHGARDRHPAHNLVPRRTSFLGRRTELRELGSFLERQDRRLVTLVGPGGIGKSRLAWQAAWDRVRGPGPFDACWFVELEDAASTEDVSKRVADAIGLPADTAIGSTEAVAEGIGDRRCLLVLDNCEHLPGVGAIVSRWLCGCRSLTILATSRDRLQLQEEWCYPVWGFSVPVEAVPAEPAGRPTTSEPEAAPDDRSAVDLFESRARRTVPEFRLEPGDVPHIGTICRLTGGSPLALELAAGCVGVMSTEEIADEIRRSLDFLATSLSNVPDRHRSLRVVFEQTWSALTDVEREALRRLAVFHGGFDREMARAVAGADVQVLASLAAQSLIVEERQGRFDRHPLIHAYTYEALVDDPDEVARVQSRHAAWFLQLAKDASAHVNRREAGTWLARLEDGHANLKAALDYYDRIDAIDEMIALTEALVDFWIRRGHHAEACRRLERVGELGHAAKDQAAFGRSLQSAAFVALVRGDTDAALGHLCRSEAIFETLGDREGVARARSLMGMRDVYLEDFPGARARYEDALALATDAGALDLTGRILNNLGDVAWFSGDLTSARASYEASLEAVRRVQNQQMVSNVLGSLGLVALEEGRLDEARGLVLDSLRSVAELGIVFSLPVALDQLACVETARGRPLRGAELWGASDELRARLRIAVEPFSRPHRDAWIERAEGLCPERRYADAYADGRTADLAAILARELAIDAGPAETRATASAVARS